MSKEKLLKYNLQFFAEDGDTGAGTGTEGEDAAAKTFTQVDVDNLIKKRLERERKNMPGKEELEAFKQWKASQSKEAGQEEDSEDEEDQEISEPLKRGEQTTQEEDKVKQLEQQLKQMELDHALDYAIKESGAKSSKLLKSVLDLDKIFVVNGTLTGFDEQIETVKKEYSYLFGEDSKSQAWGQRQKGSTNKLDPVEVAFLAKNPGLKY